MVLQEGLIRLSADDRVPWAVHTAAGYHREWEWESERAREGEVREGMCHEV